MTAKWIDVDWTDDIFHIITLIISGLYYDINFIKLIDSNDFCIAHNLYSFAYN